MINSQEIISFKWHVDEVVYSAKENGKNISRAQAVEILKNQERKHEATYGITWARVDEILNELFGIFWR